MKKMIFSITRISFILILIVTCSCQQNDNDLVNPAKEEDIVDVYDDPSFITTSKSTTNGRTAELKKFGGFKMYFRRQVDATGTLKFRLVKTTPSNLASDETTMLVSQWANVSAISTSAAGNIFRWLPTINLEVGETYRIDIVLSQDALYEVDENGVPTSSLQKQIECFVAFPAPYINGTPCIRRVGTDQINEAKLFDFKFVTWIKLEDGTLVEDQTQTSTTNNSIINGKNQGAPEGYINGQEFVFGATN